MKVIPFDVQQLAKQVTDLLIEKKGQVTEKTLKLFTVPVTTREQLKEAFKAGREIAISAQSIVAVQQKVVLAKILFNFHLDHSVRRCEKNHPMIYFFGDDCPCCKGHLTFSKDAPNQPLIVGKVIDDVTPIPK